MESTFIELRCKEVVNVIDGRRLGHFTDMVFDLGCARVLGFILPGEKTGWNIFKPSEQLFVPYGCIKRIGEDTILVELTSQGVPTNPFMLK
ncbi:MAG: YlmC/YmxH family sporulation protein [Clostridia bacterium]|nr:YlmC/YmxH family sporulation protein [Clostridia bacterium]MBQ8792260.1 YlmC/YmxH family sporulation protein [Clostridia bacterium]